LQDIAPREASVLFHMGKIYKKLDMLDQAMTCFCGALDLQPASADTNLIKAAIERIKVADEQEEEEL
jgi:anaphase-promoting complex subunit 3